MHLVKNIVSLIIKTGKKYNFCFLDEFENTITLEYTGDDMVYMSDDEIREEGLHYDSFTDEQGKIVRKNMNLLANELRNKNSTKFDFEYWWDSNDYPCIIIEVK